jgi:hypothetical protein
MSKTTKLRQPWPSSTAAFHQTQTATVEQVQTEHPAGDLAKHGIFGVPLRQSITYANVAISLVDENGKSYIYGYVPIVVAKCGVFLKEKGAMKSCFPLARISF